MPGLKRPLSRSEGDGSKSKETKKAKSSGARAPPAASSSSLVAHEVDFPRGGGSTLTPFEHQQVLREVKAETSAAKKAKSQQQQSDDLFTDGDEKKKLERQRENRERKNAIKKKSSIGNISRKSKGNGKEVDQDRPARIESLNYKRLATGTRLLCSVLAVHPLAVILSLPNQLLGHVPITNISDILTSRLEGAADESSSEDEDDEEDSDEQSDNDEKGSSSAKKSEGIPDLKELFHVGQWLVASVAAVQSSNQGRAGRGREGGEYEHESRKVELTLEPSSVNEGITIGDLSPGYLLPMAVKSREDHGYLMHCGVEGLGGFVSFKEAPKEALQIGQVVNASVLKVDANGRSVSASLKTTKVISAQIGIAPTISALLPGNQVRGLIMATSEAGMNVKLFGLFDATIDSFHLDHEAEYKVGQHIKARILWDIGPIGAEENLENEGHINQRKIALSAADHIVKLDTSEISMRQAFPLGAVVSATVLSTTEDWGLTCSIKDSEMKGFTHISACSDSHIASLPSASGAFRIGTKHQARVIGHSLTDQVLQLSFQQSVLTRSFMRVSEVIVGDIIKGTIKAVSEKSIILDINGSVDGVVFPLHFADIPLKKPERKYKVGQSIKARVWKVDPEKNRIALTLKKTLVQSDLAVVGTLQDARVGVVTHGTVAKVLEGNAGPMAVLVDLFGQLRAYVPVSEAIETAGSSSDSIKNTFFVGKCVKVRLTRVDYETGKIAASIRQASESFLKRLNVDAVQVGETVRGKLAAVHQDVIVLELDPTSVRALMSLSALAKERKTTVDELRAALTEGELIENVKVVSKNGEKGIVILGGLSSREKTTDADVKEGSMVKATVRGREKNTALLRLGQNVHARLHVSDCVDDYGSGEQSAEAILPATGTQLDVFCLSMRGNAPRKADVSIRASRVSAGGDVRDEEINTLDQLKVGSKVRGFVKGMAEKGGLFVDLGRSVTARIMIAELFDSYIKDWTSRFTIGQLVEGTITSVQPHQNKVEMSLKTEPGKKASRGRDGKDDAAASSSSSKLKIEDFEQGQKVKAFVKSITEYGLFLRVDDSACTGLAHRSQLSDDNTSPDVIKAFSIGDRVKAKVLKVDLEKKRLSFGLKPSLFDEADFESDGEASEQAGEEDDGESAGDSDVEMDASALLNEVDSDEESLLEVNSGTGSDEEDEEDEEESDDHDGEEDDDSDEGELSDDNAMLEMDSADEDDSMSEDDEEEADTAVPVSKVKPALELAGGFSWSAGGMSGYAESSDSSSEEEEEEEEKRGDGKKKRRAKKQVQEDLTADLATKTPDSLQDFERLLLGSPNSSYLWIQYMSFQLQLGDVAKARDVARRALQVINFREEQEKFNIWIALLNLENTFGSEETLEETYKEACAYNDEKQISLRFAEILERSHKQDKADEQWKRTTKKFGFSSSVWVDYHRYLLRTNRPDDARAMIPRSMQSLERRKHVKTIIACALDDFKVGDAERGRTIFEGLADTYPKRLDIWWQYVDQEIRARNTVQVRDLFERMLALKQSSKKVKSILKKWLEYEKKHGTQQGEQAVLSRARQFVEERAKAAAGGEGEDEEDNNDEE